MSEMDTFKTFVSAIFYIGKGSRSRPYAHLHDTLRVWKSMGRGEQIAMPKNVNLDKPLPNKVRQIN